MLAERRLAALSPPPRPSRTVRFSRRPARSLSGTRTQGGAVNKIRLHCARVIAVAAVLVASFEETRDERVGSSSLDGHRCMVGESD